MSRKGLSLAVATAAVLVLAVAGLPTARVEVARAATTGQAVPAPSPVRRPLHNMVEGYAEGKVVAHEYLQTYYCPTMPSSDLDPPFGHGDGHPQSEDWSEYQVPPCFFGDTGTGSILPADLQAGAFPGVRTFYAIAPFFTTGSPGSGEPPAQLGIANSPASDVDTQCTEPGPPVTEHRGHLGTCLMHPSTIRVAQISDDPNRQPPDPVALPHHSHVLPEASGAPGWWNIQGVQIYERSIWPDHDGNCPAGPPHCVTSIAGLRAAQKAGQASVDLPSNLYFYFATHPER